MDEEKVKQEAEALIQDMQSNPNRFATYVANNAPSISIQNPVVSNPTQPSTPPVVSNSSPSSTPTQAAEVKTETTTQSKQSKEDRKKYGKRSKEEFLDRDGDLIDKNNFLRNIRHNKENFLKSIKDLYNQEELQQISKAIDSLWKGIKDGTVIPEGPGYARVKSDQENIKNKEGKKEFDDYGVAYNYINKIYDNQSSWTNPEADKPEDIFSPDNFIKALNKELFAGREDFDSNFWGQDAWDETTQKRGTKERASQVVAKLQKLRQDIVNGTLFEDADDTQKSTTLGYIDQAIKALSDGDISEQDRLILSNIGIDYDKYFGTGKEYNEEPEPEKPEDTRSELEKEWEEFNKEQDEFAKRQYMDTARAQQSWLSMADSTQSFDPLQSIDNSGYWSFYSTLTGDNKTAALSSIKEKFAIVAKNMREGKKNPLEGALSSIPRLKRGETTYGLWANEWRWSAKLNAILQAAYKLRYELDLPTTSDGDIIIATDKTGLAYCYNPSTRRVYKRTARFVLNRDTLEKEFAEHYGLMPSTQSSGMDSAVVSQKQGGVLQKFFIGGSIEEARYAKEAALERARLLKEQQEQTKKKELEDAAARSGRTVEQYKAGQEKLVERGLKTEDGLRIAAAAADVTALIASFVPTAGTAVAAGAGLTSLGLDMAADIKDDSVSGWQVAKNAAMNLGLSLVALVPGGGAGKVFKSVKRILPLAIQAYTSMGVLMDKDVQASVNKMFNGKDGDFTVDDWKNVLSVLKVVTSAGTTAGTLTKAAKYRKITQPTKTDKLRVQTKDGSTVELTKAQIEDIDAVGFKEGTAKANERFKEITKQVTGTEKELSDKVNYKTKWPFKEKRSTTLKGNEVYNYNISRDNVEARAQSMYFKQQNPNFTKFFNTDYDIFVNNKTPFTLFNNLTLTTPWGRRAAEARQKHDAVLAARAAKRAAQQSAQQATPGTSATPDPQQSKPLGLPFYEQIKPHQSYGFNSLFKHGNVQKVINLAKYKQSDGKLSAKGLAILNNLDPNWRERQYTGKGFRQAYNTYRKKQAVGNSNKPKEFTYNPENTFVSKDGSVVAYWKRGNKIQQAKEISKKKFAKGGVIQKFKIGGDVLTNYYGTGDGFSSLSGWTDKLDQSSANSELIKNGHYNAGSLDEVLNRINAYTDNQNLVGEDIQNYYNNYGEKSSLQDFVTKYNQNAAKLRNFFKEKKVYNTKSQSVRDHNQLFKQMFAHRSSNEINPYNISYQDALDDVLGSSTWLRRMDMYDKPWESLTNEEKLRRVHKVKLGDGTEGYVYKKADGDIAILSPDDYNQLLNPQPETKPEENPEQTPEQTPEEDTSDWRKIYESMLRELDNSDAYNRAWALKMASPGMDVLRYARTLGTNNQVKKVWDKAQHPVLLDTYERFSPVTGDFLGMQVMSRQNADAFRAVDREAQTNREQRDAMILQAAQNAIQNNYAASQQNDKQIRTTASEQLSRQEDNAARWSQTANTNKQTTHQSELDRAQTKNDYIFKQNEAFQNFLMGLQNQANNEWTSYQNYITNMKAAEIQKKYADKYNDAYNEMTRELAEKGGSALHTAGYQKLKKIERDMQFEMQLANYDLSVNMGVFPRWNFPYHFDIEDVSKK